MAPDCRARHAGRVQHLPGRGRRAVLLLGILLGAGCGVPEHLPLVPLDPDRASLRSGTPGLPGATASLPLDDPIRTATVAAHVRERLALHRILSRRSLQVTVRDSIVTLSGSVRSPVEQSLATRTAEDVPGVEAVHANLRLDGAGSAGEGSGAPPEDAAILLNLRSVLRLSTALRSLAITPTVQEGRVTLRGVVWNESDRDYAAETARSLEGVRSVRNLILVAAP